MAIINTSGWPVDMIINSVTKRHLLQHLILNKVVTKRLENTRHLRKGLKVTGFHELVVLYPDLCKPLFVPSPSGILTAAKLRYLIVSPKPSDEGQKGAYEYFMNYINILEGKPVLSVRYLLTGIMQSNYLKQCSIFHRVHSYNIFVDSYKLVK